MIESELKTSAVRLSSLSSHLTTKRTLTQTATAKMPLMTGTGKPRVILGTMTFGPDKEKGARITSLDTYNSILDKFQQSGYNEIDTARVYIGGKQEAFTRDAKWKERGLTCATKWYPHTTGAHKGDVVEAKLNESLKELGTECIDIFYLHAPDRSVPFKETLSKLNELHKQGKFVQLGLSNFTAFEVAECVMICHANGWVRPTIWQGMYNAITRSIEAELIPACRRYGLDVVVYNPVAGGIFSGKYKASEVPESGRFSDSEGVRGTMYRKRYFKDAAVPPGVPIGALVLVTPIELLQVFIIRPFTLAVRLFANMFAGHLLVLVFVLGGEYLLLHSEPIVNKVAGVASLLFSMAIFGLEIFVQILQAYIFTVLTAQYISSATAEEH